MVILGREINRQVHLTGQIYQSYLLRYNYSTVDWTAANTTLTLTPASGKRLLISRIGFVAYNPASDFSQTIKIEFYNGSSWTTLHEAVGFAPLILVADRIDSFKIGSFDMISIHWHFSNAIMLNSSSSERLRFTCSANLTGSDKFYAGATGIEIN